ncbi:protease SohB [Pseudomaricurvus sp. HS19]|uniref:protease SohB n=1 Tax=Pseudomaricurvus sp. HS19 TaxID=2692626 RepID=UPI00136C2087|nr:protease SohB [Pseudomaricurvus sp. HS19]MYM62341.1 protease SohB [Pseudomaricurvus sp. HS19]
MEFIAEYGLFLAKSVTVLLVIVFIVGFAVSAGHRQKGGDRGHLEVTKLNDEYEDSQDILRDAITEPHQRKADLKAQHKKEKQEEKARKKSASKATGEEPPARRVFVIDFDGDIKASAVDSMREVITGILSVAGPQDEVVVRLESGGGMVHSYGLASSQLDRIKQQGISLTVCVDKVAASGGYMMACVADRILAAPFAIMGSIGVLAQIPNFHRLLKKHDIDFEELTAGEYKRTLTMFGENDDKDRAKFVEDLEDTHNLFKEFVSQHRPAVNIEQVANGDVWYGKRALDNALVDELKTSDQYLIEKIGEGDVFHVEFAHKKTLQEKLGLSISAAADRLLLTWISRLNNKRFF